MATVCVGSFSHEMPLLWVVATLLLTLLTVLGTRTLAGIASRAYMPLMVVWLYAMAVGRGATCWLFSRPLLVRVLAPKLVLDAALLDRCIEYLIDKEYVACDDADRNVYVYVP